MFKAASDGTILKEPNTVVIANIPAQMSSEEEFYLAQQKASSTRSTMDLGILFTVGAQLFFSVSMHLIWGVINALQLVTNMKRMDRISTPGAVLLLLELIDGTVNMKI